jgi:hypothetical protein
MSFSYDNEVKKFHMNEYLNKKNIILEKQSVNSDEYDEDDLLFTNAITDDKVGDELDKSRYVKEHIVFLNVDSRSRNNTDNLFKDRSLTSSGMNYNTYHQLISYKDLIINSNNCILMFKIKYKGINIQNSIDKDDIFYISLIIGKKYDLDELKYTIEDELNGIQSKIYNEIVLNNDLFFVNVYQDLNIDPDNIIIDININELNYQDFSFICEIKDNNDNRMIYPDPNSYKLVLSSPINNVKSIRMVSNNFKNTDTIINKYNNKIVFRINGETREWTYLIPSGNYSVKELLDDIEYNINLIIFGEYGISNFMSYEYSTITGSIKIYCNNIYSFILEFKVKDELEDRNLLNMLGFNENIYYFNTEIKNNRFPMLEVSQSIWIDLNGYDGIYDIYTQKNYFNRIDFNIQSIQNLELNTIVTLFEYPIKLETLNVKLFDNRMPYNTNLIDHSFILEIIYIDDRLYATGIQSKRSHYKV